MENVTVEATVSDNKSKASGITAERVIRDLKRARKGKSKWSKEAEEDFEFAVGKQWKDEDKKTLEDAGIPALTINKIQPNLFLISGFQRQNRSDWIAYPEGDEDNLEAEIVTKLLKNAVKQCDGQYLVSEQFEDGVICGEGWIEPYVDYTNDLINGDLVLNKDNPMMIFPDPDGTKYDLSDCEFVIKVSPRLSQDQVLKLFPDKDKEIKAIENGTLEFALGENNMTRQDLDYPMTGQEDKADNEGDFATAEKSYDLVEYYYKKYVTKYIIADKSVGQLKEAKDKEEADAYAEQANMAAHQDALMNDPMADPAKTMVSKVLKRIIPEIWVVAMVGQTVLDEYISPFYPRWKSYPFFPFFAHRITTPLPKAREYMTQGIVRSLKDPQRELNKRRSQELRILNSTANSGWLVEENTWKEKSVVEKYGSTPGVSLEYKNGKPKPERIIPAPLSQGHAQLAAENTQDMKEISGINADLLAMQDKGSDASGRAIHLRQQQGIIMLQRILDNFSRTQKMIGKFILSQLSDLYTVETAMRVMGDAWIKDNFSVPVMSPTPSPVDGKPVPMLGPDGQMQMQIDTQSAANVFQLVLNGVDEGKYNVVIDETNNSPTVKLANYSMLLDMAGKGVPVPPDVLVEESQLGEASKTKIKKAIATAMSAQNAMPGANAGKPGEKK